MAMCRNCGHTVLADCWCWWSHTTCD